MGSFHNSQPFLVALELTRKQFLAFFSGLLGIAPQGRGSITTLTASLSTMTSRDRGELGPIEVTRADDLVILRFEFFNLKLNNGTPQRLVRDIEGYPAWMTMWVPPQHMAEGNTERATPPNVPEQTDLWISGDSHVAFVFEKHDEFLKRGIVWSTAGLLAACRAGHLSVFVPDHPYRPDPIPTPPSFPPTRPPVPPVPALTTAIEAPFRLILTPNSDSAWLHSDVPADNIGLKDQVGCPLPAPDGISWVELWHTRLVPKGTVPSNEAFSDVLLRAIDARNLLEECKDAKFGTPATYPQVSGLTSVDRRSLVYFSSTADDAQSGGIIASRFMLSSLGALFDAKFKTPAGIPGPPESLSLWTHDATMGRDENILKTYPGYLYPYGHRASLIQQDLREIEPFGSDPTKPSEIAGLWHYDSIRVDEPDKDFDSDTARALGAQRVSIRTSTVSQKASNSQTVGPVAAGVGLEPIPVSDGTNSTTELLFHIKTDPTGSPSADFKFRVQKVDHDNNIATTEESLIFILAGSVDTRYSNYDFQTALDTAYKQTDSVYVATSPEITTWQAGLARQTSIDAGMLLRILRSSGTAAFDVFLCVVAGATDAVDPNWDVVNSEGVVIDGSVKWHKFDLTRNQVLYRGQPIAYAPSALLADGSSALTSTLETITTSFVARIAVDPPKGTIEFTPAIDRFKVKVPEVKRLSGQDVIGTFTLTPKELADREGKIFAQWVKVQYPNELEPPISLNLNVGDVKTGLAAPNTNLVALSKTVGAVGGDIGNLGTAIDNLIGGKMNPADIFKSLQSRIFGVVDLSQFVDFSNVGLPKLGGRNAPNIVTKVQKDSLGIPKSVTATFSYETELHNPAGKNLLEALPGANLSLSIEATKALSGTGSRILKCALNHIQANIPAESPIVTIAFEDPNSPAILLESRNGEKPSISIGKPKVTFPADSKLDMIHKLADELFPGSVHPEISFAGDYIDLGLGIQIPSIPLGVLNLSHMSLVVDVGLPITQKPLMFGFSLGTAANPFTVAVGIFGGGGHFGLHFSDSFVVDGSIEFGGYAEISFIGIASGSAYLAAGVSFVSGNNILEITGYVRAGGCVSVLGLITASVSFYLKVQYCNGALSGECTLTIDIDILFFSTSVHLTMHKDFVTRDGATPCSGIIGSAFPRLSGVGRSPKPPTFIDQFPKSKYWRAYCTSFAQ